MAILNVYDGFFFTTVSDKKIHSLFAQRIQGELFENWHIQSIIILILIYTTKML